MQLKALFKKQTYRSLFTNLPAEKMDARSGHPSATDLPTGGGGDFWIIMLFIISGWGLWTAKAVRAIAMENKVAVAAPVALPSETYSEALGHTASAEEALKWINLLQGFDDQVLDTPELLKKYENLSMASAILSASSDGPIRQQFWSARAVEYSERAVSILTDSGAMLPAEKFEEVNIRLLLAMALNYLQNGEVLSEDVVNQFENIDQEYLRNHGFYRNKLLRTLAEREVIELPNYYSDYSI